MRRFFVPELGAVGARLTLPASVRRHVAVLRLEPGAEIVLFDGSGRQARARLDGDVAIVLALETATDERARVVLVQAMPKGTKSDDVVRMATELGAHAVHFALSDHAVARPDEARGSKKTSRWQRIAEEAARQCERATVPEVHAPSPLLDVCGRAPSEATRLVAWARGGRPIADQLRELHPRVHYTPPTNDTEPAETGTPSEDAPPSAREVWIAVGPEGGFSDAELAALDRLGFARVTLGPHVLRVDTAALAALAQIAALVG
jgi:16S rRNA (uracil1498-N3)-methyltransferase